jgi:Zn-dependent protease with chaperone function
MPILLVLVLSAACFQLRWPNLLGLSPAASAAASAAAVAGPLAVAFALRTRVVRWLAADPGRRVEVGRAYLRLRRLLFFVNMGSAAVAIAVLGWGHTVWTGFTVPWRGEAVPAPFAELAVPLPYFLILFGCWLIYFDAERALLKAVKPDRPFPSRPVFFLTHLRQLALFVAVPVGMIAATQTLARFAPAISQATWFKLTSIAAAPALFILLPFLVKPLLGLRPLPPGPVRDRIAATARRLNFRYADLLLWPTHGTVANAMILGLVPAARYVIFTDRILEEMPAEELEAVFGHEVGHARHGHLWYYAVFILMSMALMVCGVAVARDRGWFAPLKHLEAGGWLALPPLAVFGAYLFVVFGFLSRRCERQADVFGCRSVSCPDPACTGHDTATVLAPDGTGLCPTGIRTFVRALERVGHINSADPDPDREKRTLPGRVVRGVLGFLRAWQHSTLPLRVGFLLSLIDDPSRERRFQRRLKLLRWGLVLCLIAAMVGLGRTVSWGRLLEAM